MKTGVNGARYVAFHEAGHAVVAAVLGSDVLEAKVWKEGSLSRGNCVPTKNEGGCRTGSIICYAGPVAQAQFQRTSLYAALDHTGSSDLERIDALCQYVAARNPKVILLCGSFEKFRRGWHLIAGREARKLVRLHWDWITRVADHLAEHGRISGRQVKKLRPPRDRLTLR
jgi:hypothetical protein